MNIKKSMNYGFTLIEIMVALLLGSLVMIAIFATFMSQEKSNTAQMQILDVQQNLRAAMYMIKEDVFKGGYDKRLSGRGDFGFITAKSNQITIRFDGQKGDTGYSNGKYDGSTEEVTIKLSSSGDSDGDGIANSGTTSIMRDTNPIADGIEVLRFAYALDENRDGDLDPAGEDIDWYVDANDDGTLDGTGADLDDIKAVRVTIIGKSKTGISDFVIKKSYDLSPPTKTYTVEDKYYHRELTAIVRCRNAGL